MRYATPQGCPLIEKRLVQAIEAAQSIDILQAKRNAIYQAFSPEARRIFSLAAIPIAVSLEASMLAVMDNDFEATC